MQDWILLLRGINVGGRNILPMKDLKTLLQEMGLTSIQTYIQSGNVLFQGTGIDKEVLAEEIAGNIEEHFWFRPAILLLTRGDFESAVENNPFSEFAEDQKSIHLFFLKTPARAIDIDGLKRLQKPTEKFTLTESVFYLYAPEGIGRSKLAANAEKKIGVPITARNLRTVLKIKSLIVD